jgi:hypothetical protein
MGVGLKHLKTLKLVQQMNRARLYRRETPRINRVVDHAAPSDPIGEKGVN